MIYRSYAGTNCVQRAGFASSVDGNSLANTRGFSYGGAEFGFCVLVGRRELAIAKEIFAGFVDLYEIGAFLDLLSNYGHQFGGIIRVGSVRKNVLFGIVPDSVFVPPEDVNSIAADAQPRARNEPLIDRVAHGGRCRARAFRAHISFRREAGHKIVAGRERSRNGSLRDGLLNGLQILRSGMQK